MRRLQWLALLAPVVLLASAGCGGDDVFGLDDVVGEWKVTSINGQQVPGTVDFEFGLEIDVDYEYWTFHNGGVCTIESRYDGMVATDDNCEYAVDITQQTISGNVLGVDFDGTVNGDRMDLSVDFGMVVIPWVLRRR